MFAIKIRGPFCFPQKNMMYRFSAYNAGRSFHWQQWRIVFSGGVEGLDAFAEVTKPNPETGFSVVPHWSRLCWCKRGFWWPHALSWCPSLHTNPSTSDSCSTTSSSLPLWPPNSGASTSTRALCSSGRRRSRKGKTRSKMVNLTRWARISANEAIDGHRRTSCPVRSCPVAQNWLCVIILQKLKDGEDQVIKKRKKKEGNSIEEKKPRKNRVSKQGWGLALIPQC